MTAYISQLFAVSRMSVTVASLIVVLCGIVWLIRSARNGHEQVAMMTKLADAMKTLSEATREMNDLHQQDLDHRRELMEDLRAAVTQLKENNTILKDYGRRCDEAHVLLRYRMQHPGEDTRRS